MARTKLSNKKGNQTKARIDVQKNINANVTAIAALNKRRLVDFINIGQRLLNIKKIVARGQWVDWLSNAT